jgi:hypothetical protein
MLLLATALLLSFCTTGFAEDEPLTGEAMVQINAVPCKNSPKPFGSKLIATLGLTTKVYIVAGPERGRYKIDLTRLASDNADQKDKTYVIVKGVDVSAVKYGWVEASALEKPEKLALSDEEVEAMASIGAAAATKGGQDETAASKAAEDLGDLNDPNAPLKSGEQDDLDFSDDYKDKAQQKGFNEQTEKQHAKEKNLERAYRKVTVLEKNPGYKLDLAEQESRMEAFRKGGAIGEFAGSQN